MVRVQTKVKDPSTKGIKDYKIIGTKSKYQPDISMLDASYSSESKTNYGQILMNREDFMKTHGYSSTEIIDYNVLVSDIVEDNIFMTETNNYKVLGYADPIMNKDIQVVSKVHLCYGNAVDVTLASDSVAYDSSGKEVGIGELKIPVYPYREWTIDMMWPGWAQNVWKIFYKDYTSDGILNDSRMTGELAFWRPWVNFDDFYIMAQPAFYRGVIIWLPNPSDMLTYNWEYGTKAVYVYMAVVLSISFYIIRWIMHRLNMRVPVIDGMITRGRPKRKMA